MNMATTTREMTDNPVVQRIVDLIADRGVRDKDLTDHLGLPPGSMAKWKYDGSQVYLKYIVEICEFLETSPNYLFLGTSGGDDVGDLDPVEVDVIRMYRSIDNGRKQCIRNTLTYFTEG